MSSGGELVRNAEQFLSGQPRRRCEDDGGCKPPGRNVAELPAPPLTKGRVNDEGDDTGGMSG
jgi:hypothetical protein